MPMSEEAKRRMLGTSYDRDRAPWETYDAEMDPFRGCTQEQIDAVKRYSEMRHQKPSTQNLEELCRQKELSTEMARIYRFHDQEDLTGEGPDRVGRIMNTLEFWQKLETIIPCYVSSTIRKGLAGLAVLSPTVKIINGQEVREDWQYVCGIQVGFMHEWSTLRLDAHKVPTNEKWRGWRGVVLLRLILGGYITEKDAHKVFGLPTSGPVAYLYRKQLYAYRNRKEA